MVTISVCPACGGAERTDVSPYNGLVLLRSHHGEPVARYDYALCHRCGLVYATSRPTGTAFVDLLERFDDNLGRVDRPNLGVVEGSLSEQEKDDIRRRVRAGWKISDGREPAESEWWPMLRYDRIQSAQDLTLLASSIDLREKRVLDVRSNAGALLDSLQTWFGADVYAMPSFEADQVAIEEFYGIPARRLIDYENFAIPYDGTFDVILAKHMITHALRLDAFFAEVRAHLAPGGYLYLYLENDDAEMWRNRKNLLGELKCFHFQNFDQPTFERVLRAQGFEPQWLLHLGRSSMSCLARLDPATAFEAIGETELRDREAMYGRWYDLSVLSLPPGISRAPFADALEGIEARALERGDAERTRDSVRPPKRLKLMHEDGYVELNRRLAAADGVAAPTNGRGPFVSRALRSAARRVRARLPR